MGTKITKIAFKKSRENTTLKRIAKEAKQERFLKLSGNM